MRLLYGVLSFVGFGLGATLGLLSMTTVVPADEELVTFGGCPVPLTEHSCIGVESGGKLYDITSANPAPRIGYLGIQGEGRKSNDPNTCMEGQRLKDIVWHYTKVDCAAKSK